jgi:hypothetical protein
MVEAGLRVRAGPAEGGFVPIDPLGDAFSPPEGQRFWIREDALERPAESPAP